MEKHCHPGRGGALGLRGGKGMSALFEERQRRSTSIEGRVALFEERQCMSDRKE